jgi:cytochrome b561
MDQFLKPGFDGIKSDHQIWLFMLFITLHSLAASFHAFQTQVDTVGSIMHTQSVVFS